eukprot:scaffold387965_cov31-Prasinocladus_malaysianus.AAC.1
MTAREGSGARTVCLAIKFYSQICRKRHEIACGDRVTICSLWQAEQASDWQHHTKANFLNTNISRVCSTETSRRPDSTLLVDIIKHLTSWTDAHFFRRPRATPWPPSSGSWAQPPLSSSPVRPRLYPSPGRYFHFAFAGSEDAPGPARVLSVYALPISQRLTAEIGRIRNSVQFLNGVFSGSNHFNCTCMGAAYGTAKSGVGIASMGVMRPELVMKSIVPVVMA